MLGSALGLVYTSLFEGFGIPIVEAVQARVPVITSDVTSMPEVGGNAVLYANPYKIESIAKQMEILFNDTELRDSLIEQGVIQSRKFSWDQTAGKLWDAVLKTV